MNLSYFRINIPKEEAIERLVKWNNKNYKERIECDDRDVIGYSVDENNEWKGDCLFCYENDGWTIFEDLSGGYSEIDGKAWSGYAQDNDFIFAGSNDAIPYAEMVVIENGVIKVEFRDDPNDPDFCKNVYSANNVVGELETWADVEACTMDDRLVMADRGELLIF